MYTVCIYRLQSSPHKTVAYIGLNVDCWGRSRVCGVDVRQGLNNRISVQSKNGCCQQTITRERFFDFLAFLVPHAHPFWPSVCRLRRVEVASTSTPSWSSSSWKTTSSPSHRRRRRPLISSGRLCVFPLCCVCLSKFRPDLHICLVRSRW